MYNRNYGGFNYASTSSAQARIHPARTERHVRARSELLKSVPNRKLTHINP